MQTWDRVWTDEALYKKYGITKNEQASPTSSLSIREMNLDN
jgi:site-specific DNA-methyltransferase (adenine-specific)